MIRPARYTILCMIIPYVYDDRLLGPTEKHWLYVEQKYFNVSFILFFFWFCSGNLNKVGQLHLQFTGLSYSDYPPLVLNFN